MTVSQHEAGSSPLWESGSVPPTHLSHRSNFQEFLFFLGSNKNKPKHFCKFILLTWCCKAPADTSQSRGASAGMDKICWEKIALFHSLLKESLKKILPNWFYMAGNALWHCHYANIMQRHLTPTPSKDEHFVILPDAWDNYCSATGMPWSRRLDINCMLVKSHSRRGHCGKFDSSMTEAELMGPPSPPPKKLVNY